MSQGISLRFGVVAIALILALIAALPLFLNAGFLNTRGGGDSPFLLFRLHQLIANLRQGVFPVRWMPDAALGLGYPFFNYYAALPYFVAASLKAFGASYVLSLKLTQFLGFALAALGMQTWLHEAGYSRPQAWLATAAYTFAPFHLVNVYVRGDSLSELWAFGWYPLILLAALRLARRPSSRRGLYLALAYAGLILTHNISALIFTPFLALYLLILLSQSLLSGQVSRLPRPALRASGVAGREAGAPTHSPTPQGRSAVANLQSHHPNYQLPITSLFLFIVHCSLSIALALALAAFFWLPALLEGNYGQLGTVTQGYFNYAEHFRSWNLIQLSPLFNYEVGNGETTPFAMGFAQAVFVVFGLIALGYSAARRGRFTGHDIFAAFGFFAATFMITPLSRPLWDRLPLLPYVQFPWRFLSVQALFGAVVTGWLVSLAGRWNRTDAKRAKEAQITLHPPPREATLHLLTSIVLSALLAASSLAALRLDFIRIVDADVTAQRLQLYEYFTGNLGATIRYEYLPKWAVPRPYTSDVLLLREPRLKVLAGSASGERIAKRAASQRWTIRSDAPNSVVAVPLLYWPGWTARIDGEQTPIAAAPGLGWIAFSVPPGEHEVTLSLARTGLRAGAEFISLLAWGIVGFLALRAARQPISVYRLPIALFLAALILSAALLRLVPRPALSFTQLSADFDQLAYFHSAPIRFENGPALEGYDYSTDRLARGETIQITSVWSARSIDEASQGLSARLELISPAAVLRRDSSVLAQVDFTPATASVASLAIPTNVPPGVYFARVSLWEGGEALPAITSSGQPRGAVILRPIWVDDPGPAAPETYLADFGPAIRLAALTATQTSPEAVQVSTRWQAIGDVPQNYALALRVRDSSGGEWAALDTQPAHGFYPTGLWRPGEVVPDALSLNLPPGAPPATYNLYVTLYDAETLAPVSEYSQAFTTTLALPASASDIHFPLNDSIGLAGVDLPTTVTQGQPLGLAVRWAVLQALPAGSQARWALNDANGTSALTATLPLSSAALPEAIPAGTLVLDRPTLALPPDIAPGKYTLALALLGADGSPLATSNNLGVVDVKERARLTEAPRFAQKNGATFGDVLALEAYELEYDSQTQTQTLTLTLTLTPYWRALVHPTVSYKYFVHVFDPATEAIVAQADGYPQDSAYPTHQWAEGEVVSDTIEISLSGIAPGVYRVAVGWYDPSNPEARLAAKDAEGNELEGNRVVLRENIDIPW